MIKKITMKNSFMQRLALQYEKRFVEDYDELMGIREIVRTAKAQYEINSSNGENDEFTRLLKKNYEKQKAVEEEYYLESASRTTYDINKAAFESEYTEYLRGFKKSLANERGAENMSAEIIKEFLNGNSCIRISETTAEKYANLNRELKSSSIITSILVKIDSDSYRIRPQSVPLKHKPLTKEQILDPDEGITLTDYAQLILKDDGTVDSSTTIDEEMIFADEKDFNNFQIIRNALMSTVLNLYIKSEKNVTNRKLSQIVNGAFTEKLDEELDARDWMANHQPNQNEFEEDEENFDY